MNVTTEQPCLITFADWSDRGRALIKAHSASQWDIADWLIAGEDQFGNKAYAEAERITNFTSQTLRDFVVVANRFPASLRNYADLSFNHYRAVASVEGEAARLDWLVQASVGGPLSVRQLRDKIALSKVSKDQVSSTQECGITVLLTKNEREALNLLYQSRGVTLTEIVRPLLVAFLCAPEIQSEIRAAVPKVRNLKAQRRAALARVVTDSIQSVVTELYEQNRHLSMTGLEFVREWQQRTGRKFTKHVFNLAMRHTGLADLFGSHLPEFYGFPAVVTVTKKKCRKYRQLDPSTKNWLVTERIMREIVGFMKDKQEWGLTDLRSVVEQIEKYITPKDFNWLFRRALKRLTAENTLSVIGNQVKKV